LPHRAGLGREDWLQITASRRLTPIAVAPKNRRDPGARGLFMRGPVLREILTTFFAIQVERSQRHV
jgi:hypothetical protein